MIRAGWLLPVGIAAFLAGALLEKWRCIRIVRAAGKRKASAGGDEIDDAEEMVWEILTGRKP